MPRRILRPEDEPAPRPVIRSLHCRVARAFGGWECRKPAGSGLDVARQLLGIDVAGALAFAALRSPRRAAGGQLVGETPGRLHVALFHRIEETQARPGPLPHVDRPAAGGPHLMEGI